MRINALYPAALDEVVDVGAAKGRRDGVVNGGDGHPERAGFVPVHIHPVFRHVFQAVGADLGQDRAVGGRRVHGRHAQELVAGLHELFVAQAAAVQQLEVKPLGLAQFDHRRGREGKHHGVAELRKAHHRAPRHRRDLQLRAVAQIPVFEPHKRQPRVLPLAGEAHPGHRHDGMHGFLFLGEKVIPNIGHHFLGLFKGGIGGQQRLHHHHALILIRQVRGRHPLEEISQRPHDDQEHQHVAQLAVERMTHQSQVAVPRPEKDAVKPPEKRPQEPHATLGRLMALGHRLEEGGAEHRRQNQGNHHREQHRGDNGHGKLPVNDARGTSEEGHRAEHRREHQPDADQSGSNLVHGFARGLKGRQPLLAHDALDVFHHHNGVVHQQPDGQHHGEHGEHVNGKPEDAQHGERAQDDHRHGNGGNQGGAHVAQKHIHHQENQEDRLNERLDHFIDGHAHEGRGVIGIHHLHAAGEKVAHLGQLVPDVVRRLEGVGAGRLPNGHRRGRLAVVKGFNVVGVGAQLDPPHIPNPDHRTVRAGAQGNGGKLIRGLEQALHDDGGVQALARKRRRAAKLSGGHLDVVGPQPCNHVLHRHLVLRQLVRVDPNAHGILAAEDLHFSHPRHPRQHLLQVGLRVVAQIVAVHAAVLGDQADDHEVVARALAHLDAGALDYVRQVRHGQLELVLHLRPGQVRIRPRRKGQLKAAGAGGITGRRKVEQVVKPGHLLLDDLRDAVLDRLGRGPRVEGLDGDGRRRDGRVLRNRQVVNGQAAGHHQDDGNHPGKNRALQEEP